ncbi:MAG: acyltransferase [Candidatus Kapabacteria bacterium]|nr:acyltransferase [Candidatus Kapabacteria bacterium]
MESAALLALSNPLLTVAIYLVAVATSTLLVRYNSTIHSLVSSSATSTRCHALDGLRGYLAVGVFASHVAITWMYITQGKWMFPKSHFYTLLGEVCVTLFFMMTGFLFWTKLIEFQSRSSRLNGYWQNFIIGRVWRIYPLYFFMLGVIIVIVFALQNWKSQEPLLTTIIQCLRWLTFSMTDINQVPDTGLFIAFVAWSLRYEWLFYLVFLVSLLVVSKTHRDWVALVIGIILVTLIIYFDPTTRFYAKHCVSFLGGVIASYSVRHQPIKSFIRHPAMNGVAFCALLYVLFFLPSATSPAAFVLLTLFFTIIAAGNMLLGVLRPQSVLWLGEISYSIYLLHGLILWFVGQYVFTKLTFGTVQPAVFIAMSLVIVVCIVLLCSLTHLVIERPGIEMGKRIINSLRKNKTSSSLKP